MRSIKNWDDAESILQQIGLADAKARAKEAERDRLIQRAAAGFDSQIQKLRDAQAALEQALEAFARKHEDELGESRSWELNSGVLGFRLGKPMLQIRSGMTWDKVVNRLLALRLRIYIRLGKPSVNKVELLKAELPTAKLREIGVKVAQDDHFYYAVRT